MNSNVTKRCLFLYCLLTVLFSTLVPRAASGTDTGWHYPARDSTGPGSTWLDPSEVLTCDETCAYQMGLVPTDTIFGINCGFDIPANSVIDSIWYKYTGYGSSDGAEALIQIGIICGANRGYFYQSHLTSTIQSDSASLTSFDPAVINAPSVNSGAFGLYAVTAGDDYLTDTYLDCMAVRIFYHLTQMSPRRQRLIKMEDK